MLQTDYNRKRDLYENIKILETVLDKKNTKTHFIKYKLFMYKFYKEFLEKDIIDFNRVVKLYNAYPRDFHIEEPSDNLEFYNYDEFLKRNCNRYLFLNQIKGHLIQHYENRLEDFYKKIYHPAIVASMLDDGYEIEDAFSKLDEQVTYVNP